METMPAAQETEQHYNLKINIWMRKCLRVSPLCTGIHLLLPLHQTRAGPLSIYGRLGDIISQRKAAVHHNVHLSHCPLMTCLECESFVRSRTPPPPFCHTLTRFRGSAAALKSTLRYGSSCSASQLVGKFHGVSDCELCGLRFCVVSRFLNWLRLRYPDVV